MLMLLFRVVPLLSIDEIEEIEQMQELSDIQKHLAGHPHAAPSEPARDDTLVGATGKSHRLAGATGVLLLVALMGMLGVSSADHSEAATPPTAPTVTLTGVEAGGSVPLTARLTSAKGTPLPNAHVAFLLSTTEFGSPARLIPLGSASTDKTGLAALTYQPKVTGSQGFAATYTAPGGQPGPRSPNTPPKVHRRPGFPRHLPGTGRQAGDVRRDRRRDGRPVRLPPCPGQALGQCGQGPCHRPVCHRRGHLAHTGRSDLAGSPRLPGRPAASDQI